MKAKTKTALADWFAEIEKAQRGADADGMSAEEMAAAVGHSKDWVLNRLKLAKAAGWLVRGQRRSLGVSDKPCLIPVYRLVRK